MDTKAASSITDVWSLLHSNVIFAVIFAILALCVVIMFVFAFIQGRSVSLWPPKVGPKPSLDFKANLKASALTPTSGILEAIIKSSLETVCRAVSLPHTPQSAKIRVFIFKKEEDWLVCRFYWSQDPTKEQVGKLRFNVSADVARTVAVVRACLDQQIFRTSISAFPEPSPGIAGTIDDRLSFVLAAPIFDDKGSVWGTVDFDTSSEAGKALLSTEVSDAVMHQLARHLQIVFKLDS
jgi:hypothetical protein